MQFFIEILFETFVKIPANGVLKLFGFKKDLPSWFAYIGCIFLGTFAGIISIPFFPTRLIQSKTVGLLNLFVTPLLIALLVKFFRSILKRYIKKTIFLDSFWYSSLMLFFFLIMRFFFCKSS